MLATRRPCGEQHATGIGVPKFENSLLSASGVHMRFDVDWIVRQNLLNFESFDPMRSDVALVMLIPVIPRTHFHVNTFIPTSKVSEIQDRNLRRLQVRHLPYPDIR